MKSNCEECIELDEFELPINNRTISGTLQIEQAFVEAHDFVSRLVPVVPVPSAAHGAWRGNDRYCVPCDLWRDGFNNPLECKCGSPWDMPAP